MARRCGGPDCIGRLLLVAVACSAAGQVAAVVSWQDKAAVPVPQIAAWGLWLVWVVLGAVLGWWGMRRVAAQPGRWLVGLPAALWAVLGAWVVLAAATALQHAQLHDERRWWHWAAQAWGQRHEAGGVQAQGGAAGVAWQRYRLQVDQGAGSLALHPVASQQGGASLPPAALWRQGLEQALSLRLAWLAFVHAESASSPRTWVMQLRWQDAQRQALGEVWVYSLPMPGIRSGACWTWAGSDTGEGLDPKGGVPCHGAVRLQPLQAGDGLTPGWRAHAWLPGWWMLLTSVALGAWPWVLLALRRRRDEAQGPNRPAPAPAANDACDPKGQVPGQDWLQRAAFDSITGLPGRDYWMAQVQIRLDRRTPRECAALAIVDVDQFKLVNETHGHQRGDVLLQQLARRLLGATPPGSLLARLGADDFVLFMDGVDDERQIRNALRQLAAVWQMPLPLDEGVVVEVTATLGYALCPQHGSTLAQLLSCADAALAAAKKAGRNGMQVFHPEMSQAARRRLELETALRSALQRRGSGALALHLQPKVRAVDGGPCGFELLLRCHLPGLGHVGPDEAVAVVENSGLIHPLGDWIWEEAGNLYGQLRERATLPQGFRLAVNLSALELEPERLRARLAQLIERFGAPLDWLELEVTESVLLHGQQASVSVLHELHRHGIHLSIDDFGTGYSSLAYIKKLPFDTLKIDRSFVHDLDHNPDSQAIVRATISMSHDLGMSVVAEGVETQQQVDRLRALGCDILQGWRYGKAMPLEAALVWMNEHG